MTNALIKVDFPTPVSPKSSTLISVGGDFDVLGGGGGVGCSCLGGDGSVGCSCLDGDGSVGCSCLGGGSGKGCLCLGNDIDSSLVDDEGRRVW